MLIQQIDQSSILALIGLLGTVLPVGTTYVFTKRKEINANIREEKTKKYDALLTSLTKLVGKSVGKPDTDIIQNILSNDAAIDDFVMAYYGAAAYASDSVIEACHNFFMSVTSKTIDTAKIILQVSDIYSAIRFDINPRAHLFLYPVQSPNI